MTLTSEQRKKARKALARDRGVGEESISNESIDLAIMAGTITMSDCGPDSVNSYSAPLDSGSSSGSDSGSSGGGCD